MARPGAENGIVWSKPGAMRAFLIDVHFHRYSGLTQRQVEIYAVLDRYGLVFRSVKEKGGRGVRGDLQFVRQQLNQRRIWIVTEQIGVESLCGRMALAS